MKRRFDLDKFFVHNFQDLKVFCIWIKSDKGAVNYLFNMFLSLYFVFNVCVMMVNLIAFIGQFIPWKIKVNSVFSNTKLVNHFFTVKGLHDLPQGVLVFAQPLDFVKLDSKVLCQIYKIRCWFSTFVDHIQKASP